MRIPPDVQVIINRALGDLVVRDHVHEAMARAILLDREARRTVEIGGMTERQRKTLDYIERYIRDHRGVSPTYREIAAAVGFHGPAVAYRVVHNMSDRGFLRTDGGSRSIRLKVVEAA